MKKSLSKNKYWRIVFINLAFIILLITIVPRFYNKTRGEVVLPETPDAVSNEAILGESLKIVIPEISVNAKIEPVGRTAGGNMAVTRSYSTVGWYKYGAKPGETGNAVLAGHLDNGYGRPGVFYHLNDLKIGDSVFVENEEGERIEFAVKGIQVVDYLNPPKEVLDQVFGTSTTSHLNLITCDGVWIPEKKKYSDRLIIFTDRVK